VVNALVKMMDFKNNKDMSNSETAQQLFTVKYYAGTYSGTRRVWAVDEEEAINKVKAEIHKAMTLPMYSESYKIVPA
jgi:hypothetical protein